jgi:hypothetical protein
MRKMVTVGQLCTTPAQKDIWTLLDTFAKTAERGKQGTLRIMSSQGGQTGRAKVDGRP